MPLKPLKERKAPEFPKTVLARVLQEVDSTFSCSLSLLWHCYKSSACFNTSQIHGLAALTPACSVATMGGCRPMHLTLLNDLELLATALDV